MRWPTWSPSAWARTAADHSLLILPLFHVNGIVVSVLSPLLAGGQRRHRRAVQPDDVLRRRRAVPPDLLLRRAHDLHACWPRCPTTYDPTPRRCGSRSAAPRRAQPSCSAASRQRYGFPMVEGYGLSEGTCASTINPLDGPRKPGTVGLPLPGQEVRIVGTDGRPAPRRASGRGGRRAAPTSCAATSAGPRRPPQTDRRRLAAHRRRRPTSTTTATSCSSTGRRT